MKTKRIVSLLMTLALLCSTVLSVSAGTHPVLDWSQFRGSALGAGTTDAKLPISSLQVEEKWSLRLGTGWAASVGTPIIVGDYVYVYGNHNLNRIDRQSGELVKAVSCPGASQFFSQIAHGEGKIFVPRSVTTKIDGINRSGVVVYAYDEQTMELLWTSELLGNPTDSLQPLSAITYYNGYLYLGLSNSKADKGLFVCLSAEDEQPKTAEEQKKPVWTYSSEQGNGGFYWSAGAIVGNAIVFAGENGVLVSHSLTDGRVYDTLALEDSPKEGVRSTVAYDAETGRVFISSKSGMLHSVKVSQSGRFDGASHLSRQLDKDITSSPVVYNGRVYQGGGGIQSEAGFSVLDAETLEVIYTIPQIKTQSSPILTTAYASKDNGNRVYLYVTKYTGYENGGYAPNSSCTYVIQDGEGQTQPSFEELITPSQLQYCTQSLAVGEDGSFCYYNDSAKLFYFGHKNPEDGQYTPEDVQRAIDRLPSADHIALTDETAVTRTQERFASLSGAQQEQVSNAAVLQAAVEKIAQLTDEAAAVAYLIEKIEQLDLDRLTIEDYADVMALQAKYQALSQQGKEQVTNAAALEQAVEAVTNRKNQQDAHKVEELFSSLPKQDQLTKGDADTVNQVYMSYQNLSDGAKAMLSQQTVSNIEAAKQRVDFLVEEIDAINLAIWKLPVDQITLQDQTAVHEIVNRYQALGTLNQGYIIGYEDVKFSQQVLEGLSQSRIIAAVFQRIQGRDRTYTYSGEADGRQYAFAFAGQSVTDSSMDFSAGVSFATDHATKIAALADAVVAFQTRQQGAFPGEALLTIDVDWADGKYTLYRYDGSGKTERLQMVTVSAGKAEIPLAQGGEYFLAKSLKTDKDNENVNNGIGSGVQTGDASAVGSLLFFALTGYAAMVLTRKRRS
ncbi:MAG: hypothetical protein HFE39_03235 [Clostridiales bacterium]|jgi:hypothetical protein|nr:hypothetical protein [Clostridiales bacterium]